jgi:starch synthase
LTAALFFRPDAYSAGGSTLRGRNVAGESFLRGYFAHATAGEFWVRVDDLAHAKLFADAARHAGRLEPVNAVDGRNLRMLAHPGALHLPAPTIASHAWQRALVSHRQWSLTGITHTTATARVMDSIADLLTAPVQPWDALICTSNAVKQNVEQLLHSQAAYLRSRLGATRIVLPQLPVIPLGIHSGDLAFSPEQRQAARTRLGLGESALIVLYVGRLSFHAKAHPLAMYQALERTAQRLPSAQLVLVECGWYATEGIAQAYREAAQLACPDVPVISLDGRNARERETAWASADVFCSLSDNIQETLGLTPIEAMAAGLPAVVSDWNGYRDTIRHEIDGFRVPTLMPQSGLGQDIAADYALGAVTYDRYCGTSCMMIAVDVEATVEALVRLLASPDLRRRMGEAGRARAREMFDWAAIVPRYQALWEELREARTATTVDPPEMPERWPARMDPFAAFSGYPTTILTSDRKLALVDENATVAAGRVAGYRSLTMVGYADNALPSEDEILMMLRACASGPIPAGDIVADLAPERRARGLRSLAWLAKLGIVRVVG